jgi:hypothetical protein
VENEKIVMTTLRLPVWLLKKAKIKAIEDGISLAQMIIHLLTKAVD